MKYLFDRLGSVSLSLQRLSAIGLTSLLAYLFCAGALAQSTEWLEAAQIYSENGNARRTNSQVGEAPASSQRSDGAPASGQRGASHRRLTHEQREELRREIREAGQDVYPPSRKRDR